MTRLHAVLVGVSSYADSSIPDLRFAAGDARALSDAFHASIHSADASIHLLTDEDATREEIMHLVGTTLPRRATSDDLVLFYFAGHGSPETEPGMATASRFLACHDTRRNALFATAIDVTTDLTRAAQRLRAKLVIFMLDACFSGYSGGRSFVGPALEAYRRERRPGLRLADVELGSGVVFLGASTDTEVAWEDERLGHGIFTYYVLSGLTDAGTSGSIGLGTLYDLVHAQVISFSRNRQHPVLWGNVSGASLPRLSR
jgi:uncharacterized caspase-like protein